MVNSVAWLGREKFVKRNHLVHFFLTAIFMTFSALPSGCSKTEALLVDDVLFNLIPLRAIMEDNFNTKCDDAINGLQAVELYKQSMAKTCSDIRYKLILTDIQMPEMDGISEATEIKRIEQELRETNHDIPEVRIVMITAYDTEEAVQKCRDIGVTDYSRSRSPSRNLCPSAKRSSPMGVSNSSWRSRVSRTVKILDSYQQDSLGTTSHDELV